MISRQFFKSSIIYAVVGALPSASGIILIPFFTSKLSSVDFGVNALYFSIMYLVQIIASFGLDTYTGIHYYEYKDDKKKLNENIGTVIAALLFIGLFVLIASLLTGDFIFSKVINNQYLSFYPWGFITVITAILNGFFKTYSSLLINQQKPEKFFWINITNFIMVIGVSIALLEIFPFTLNGPMFGRLIPAIVSFIIVMYFMLTEFGFSINKKLLKSIYSFCAPFVIYAILLWVIGYIDRFIITHYMVDPTFVGIFDFAVKCTMMIDFVQMGLANTIHPKVYSIWKESNLRESTPEVNRYYNGYTATTLLIIPLLILFLPLLVPLIVKNQIYYQAFAFLGILSVSFASRGLFNMFLAPIFYFKKTKVLPKVFFITAVFQIVITVVLVKYFNIMGAVWASFIVKILQVVFLYFESRKIFRFKFNLVKQIYLPVICILVVLLTESLIPYEYAMLYRTAQLIIIFALVLSSYWNELKAMPFLKRFLVVKD